jgi:hypothetical protein
MKRFKVIVRIIAGIALLIMVWIGWNLYSNSTLQSVPAEQVKVVNFNHLTARVTPKAELVVQGRVRAWRNIEVVRSEFDQKHHILYVFFNDAVALLPEKQFKAEIGSDVTLNQAKQVEKIVLCSTDKKGELTNYRQASSFKTIWSGS